jgi:hypothetical protein
MYRFWRRNQREMRNSSGEFALYASYQTQEYSELVEVNAGLNQ